MREIKFRAWDKETTKIYQVAMWVFPCYRGVGLLELKDYPNTVRRGYGQVEIMQFTGLHDKNGKEIYEGDIVVYYAGATRKIKQTYMVEFHPEGHGFRSIGIDGRPQNTWVCLYQLSQWGEVIGNIYENENLLT